MPNNISNRSLISNEELEHEGAGVAMPSRTSTTGTLYRLQSRHGGGLTAVFVPKAALRRDRLSILVWVHGLTRCGGEGKDAFDYVRSRRFPFTSILSDSGHPLVLAVPSMGWTRGQGHHRLGSPAAMNAFIEEVRASLRAAGWTTPPVIDKVILAGHSKAYVVLDALAGAAGRGDPDWARGALAKVSDVWALDSTYGGRGACEKWLTFARARPKVRLRVLYRERTPTAAAATCMGSGGKRAGLGNLVVEPFAATVISHCDMPRLRLPRLLATLARGARRAPGVQGEMALRPRGRATTDDPLALLAPSELKAVRITSTFETGRPLGFNGLTANIDGQGLSFGLMNWTIKAGSLIPLLQEFMRRHADRYRSIFGADAERFRHMVFATGKDARGRRTRDVAAQMAFVTGTMNDARQRNIVQPWKGYFDRLADDLAFRRIQVEAVKRAMATARRWFHRLGFATERGFVFLFDLVSSHGGAWLNAPKFRGRRERRLAEAVAREKARLGRALNDREHMAVIAHMIADDSSPTWRARVRTRKLWFVSGVGKVHGKKWDIQRDFGVGDGPPDFGAAATAAPAVARELSSPRKFGRPAGRIPIKDRIDPGQAALVAIDERGAPSTGKNRFFLHPDALAAFRALRTDALTAGFSPKLFTLKSAWRPQKRHAHLAAQARARYGAAQAGTWVAQGRSEHLTGRAFDLNLGLPIDSRYVLSGAFEKLRSYQWLKKNAAKYGLNPYVREPWHWSYNVVEANGVAKELPFVRSATVPSRTGLPAALA